MRGILRVKITYAIMKMQKIKYKEDVKMKTSGKILKLLLTVSVVIVLLFSAGCDEPKPSAAVAPNTEMNEALKEIFEETVMKLGQSKYYEYNFAAMDYKVLSVEENINAATVYAVVMYREYSYASDEPSVEFGYHKPVKAMFSKKTDGYALISYDVAPDGEQLPEGFPDALKADADPAKYEAEHSATCMELAKIRYKMISEYLKYPLGQYAGTFKHPKELYETSVADSDRYSMHVINSLEEVVEYFNMHIESYLGIPMIPDRAAELDRQLGLFLEKYPAETFEDTSLIFIHYVATCWVDECELEGVYNDGERLTVYIVEPEKTTFDALEGHILVLAIPREDIKNCTEFSLEMKGADYQRENYVCEREGEDGKNVKFRLFVPLSPYGEGSFFVDPGFNGESLLRDGYLYMYTSNDKGHYVFKNLDGNRYEFVAEMSTGDFGGASLRDGEIFTLRPQ